MSLAIIHLTDIHIESESDFILNKAEKIFDACSFLRASGVVEAVIVVTGDLSCSGEYRQFGLSFEFLNRISLSLSSFLNCSVKIIVVPGNHDCNFSDDHCQKMRSVFLDKIQRNAVDGFDADFVSEVLKSQDNYFSSVSSTSFISLTRDEAIARYVVLDFHLGKICFLLYNTAWISERHEKPGSLCMPINLISDDVPSDANLYVSLAHHPLHWLNPDNMIAFRSIIRKTVDISLWGHEHYYDNVQEAGDGWNLCSFEGKELQEKGSSYVSNFSIYILDNMLSVIDIKYFSWKVNRYILKNISQVELKRNVAQFSHTLFPNEDMMRELNDYGTLIHHPCRENIFFDDLFVWPDLFVVDLKNGNDTVIVSSKNEVEKMITVGITLVVGDDTTGKTALSKKLYRSYLSRGKCCLLVKGEALSARNESRLNSQIESFFSEQYARSSLEHFRSLCLNDRVLIIDDFDGLVQSNKKYGEIIEFLKNMFGSIILFTGVDVNITYIITQLKSYSYHSFSAYRIKYFGNARRHDIIEKWYSITEESDVLKREFLISKALNIVNNIIEKFSRIVPATPLLVVTVLQTLDSGNNSNFTQYSYMYDQLVQKSLSVISCDDQATQNIFIAILSNIAYKMLSSKKRYIVSSDLISVITCYQQQKLISFNPVNVIKQLSNSSILILFDGDKYRFRYPYMYYYFAGLYISRNLNCVEVKSLVDRMSEHLFVEDYGNIMVFVCHFTNDEYVIDSVLIYALCSLEQFYEFNFTKPYLLFDDFDEIINQCMRALCVGDERDVNIQRQYQLEEMDAKGIKDGGISVIFDEDINDEPMDIADIISAIRVIDVIGQILRNYPGEIEGEKKIEMISGITRLAMRIVGLMYLAIGVNKDEFIRLLTEVIRETKPNASISEITSDVKMMFASLIFGTACGMLYNVSSAIGSSVLLPAIKSTRDRYSEDLSLSLIYAHTSMLSYADNWYEEILSLGKYLKQNKLEYAYQTMRVLVAKYLRTNHCKNNQRNTLCDIYELSKNKTVSILPNNIK